MANAAVDQDLVDQLADALGESTTGVTINVTDTSATFNSSQSDSADPAKVAHRFSISTKSNSLITAIVGALQATGRP